MSGEVGQDIQVTDVMTAVAHHLNDLMARIDQTLTHTPVVIQDNDSLLTTEQSDNAEVPKLAKLYYKDANWIFSVYAVLPMVATWF